MNDFWDAFTGYEQPQYPKQQQQKQQQSAQQAQTKAKLKQTTKKATTGQQKQQNSEQDIFNAAASKLMAILTGKESPERSELFKDIIKEREKIEKDLQNTLQEYNGKMKELADFTQKFNDAHSKMIGLFALMLGKSDLAKHTNEHLFDKMRELVLHYPVDVVPLAMRSLITGYFAGKQAGVDTDGMSVGELITMGENPEFVSKLSPKSMEFLGQLIDAMPQIFQMKVAPYKIYLDKLQNEAKILELKQTHQENMLTKLEQDWLRQVQLINAVFNYILAARTKIEEANIRAGAQIKSAEIRTKGKKKEETGNPLTPEEIRAIQELAGNKKK